MGNQSIIDTQVLSITGSTGDVMTLQADGTYLPETPSGGGTPGGSSGQMQYNNAGAFGGTTAVVYAGSGTHVTVTSQTATDVPLKVKAAASQTANLMEWVNSAGVAGAKITAAMQFSNSGGITNAEKFGASSTVAANGTAVGCSADGNKGVAVGYLASSDGSGGVAVGRGSNTENGGVAVGNLSDSGMVDSVAIGRNADAAGGRNVVIGTGAIGHTGAASNQDYCVAIGNEAVASEKSIALGAFANNTADNQFVAGSSTAPITTVVIGNGATNASPTGVTLHATEGNGTDIAGATLKLQAGRGTGTGNSGKVQLVVAPAGSSGASLNTLVVAAEVDTSTTASNTRLLLWDVDAAALVRVSVGAADSGGSGFKLLRVPN